MNSRFSDKAILSIFALLFALSSTAQANDPQPISLPKILQAIQERHAAVMNRDWAIEEYETILQQEDGDSNATNDFTVELIDWVHLTGDNPTQQSIDSLTMDQLLDLLNQASQELDRIKVNFLDLPGDPISGEEIAPVPGFSTYDAISLPSFGPVHHFNLSQFPIHAAKTLNELTHLEWPILRRDYETRNSDGRDDLGNSDYTPIYIGFDYYKNLGFYGDDFIRLFHSPIFSHVPSLGRYFVKEPNWRTEYSFTLPQERSFFKTKAYGWTESDFDYSIDEAADRHLARHIAYRKQIRSGFNLAIGDEDSVIEEGQIFLLHARRWNEEIIALEDAEELTETEEFHYAGYLFLHDEDVNHQQHYDYGTVPEEQIQDFSSFKIAEFHWEDLPFNTLMFGDMHSDLQVAGEWYDVEFENYELDPDGDYVSLLRRFIPSFWEYNILTLYEDIDGDYEYREHDVFPEGTEIVDGSPTNPPLETPEVELYRGTVSVVFSPKFETYFEPESIAPTILYASPERGELEISNDLLQLKIGLGRGKSKHHPGFLILEDIATPKDYSGSNLSQLISGLADPVRLRPVMLSNDFEILYAFAPGEIPDPLQWWELETPPLSDKLRSDPRWSPRIRQIIGSEVAVDIQMAEVQIDQETHLSPYEYTIKLYHSDQVGSKEDRYYTFSGEPFQTYHVETPEPDEETDLLFTITSNKQIITLEREEDEVTIKYQDKNDSSNVITHTRSSVSHISQNIISDQHETLYSAYRFVSMGNNGLARPHWERIPDNQDPEHEITYSYHNQTDALLSIKTEGPGWFWTEFDEFERPEQQVRQFLDNPYSEDWPDNPNWRTEWEYDGNEITETRYLGTDQLGQTWTEYSNDFLTITVEEGHSSNASPGDPHNLTTITRLYDPTDASNGAMPWQVQSITWPDDTATVYEYAFDSSSGELTVTESSGVPDSASNPTSITQGYQSVTTTNRRGELVSSETETIGFSSDLTLSQLTASFAPSGFQQPTSVTSLGGQTSQAFSYDSLGRLNSSTNSTGRAHTVTHRDGFGRPTAITSSSSVADLSSAGTVAGGSSVTIVPSYEGLTRKFTYTSGNEPTRTVKQEHNLLGQMVLQEQTGPGASRTEAIMEDGVLVGYLTTDEEHGHTGFLEQRFFPDGMRDKILSSAFDEEHFAYEVQSWEGKNYFTLTRKWPQWGWFSPKRQSTTWIDSLGRVVRVDLPSADESDPVSEFFYYNESGQLTEHHDRQGLIQALAYHPLGFLEETGLIASAGDSLSTATARQKFALDFTSEGQKTTHSLWEADDWQELSRTTRDPASLATTVTPYDNPALAVTSSLDVGTDDTPSLLTLTGLNGSTQQAFGSDGETLLIEHFNDLFSNDPLESVFLSRSAFGASSEVEASSLGRTRNLSITPEGRPESLTITGTTGSSVPAQDYQFQFSGLGSGGLNVNLSGTGPASGRNYRFDGQGRLLEQKGPGLYDVNFNYGKIGDSNKTISMFNTYNEETIWNTTFYGDVLDKIYPEGSTGPSLTYSPSGLLQSATLGGQTIQSFFYGENNHRPDQLTRVQYNDPEDPSAEISLSYDDRERLKTVSDPVGARSYAYHFNGSLKEENHTAGPWADWTLERDPEGDPLFRPRTLRLKDDETTVYSVGRDYLGYSRLLKSLSRSDHTVTYTHQPDKLLLETVTWDSPSEDSVLNQQWGYDGHHRLESLVQTFGGNTVSRTWTYDDNNRRTTATREDGFVWHYEYDSRGQLTLAELRTPEDTPVPGRSFQYTFDGIGRPLEFEQLDLTGSSSVNLLNQIKSFTREGILDVLGSVHPNATVEAVVWPDHPVVLLGDWTAATDPADYHGAHYLHNGNTGQGEKQIRFTAPVEPGQWQVDFRWAEDETHASRTILRLQWPGQETEETFPVDQRTDGGQWNTLHTINVEESGDLRLRVLTAATDGVVTADALRLTRLDDGAEIILDAGGQHSATGNLPTPASGVETATTHSGTNTGGQYHIAIPVDNSAGPVRVNFDVIGTVPGVAWNDTDAVAELSASALVPPAAETYSHDLAGNVTANWRWDFTWDARNQLRSVQTSADAVQAGERNQRLTFSYDAFGRRTIKRVHHWDEDTSSFLLQKSTFYLYNGWDLIRKVTYAGDGINLNDRLTTTAYTWGADHSQVEGGLGGAGGLVLIEHTDHASDTTSTWYPLYEGGGNIIGLVDADTEERVATYEYTPFGRLLRSEGPAAEKNPIRFATKYRDAETGLINFGLRLYDPTTGQWLSRDPMGEAGGLNLYAYTNNDPVNYVDVLGLKGVPCNSPWLEVEGPWNPSNLFNTASAFPRGRSSDSSTGRPNPLQGPGFLFQMETWLALVELQSDALVYGYYHMGDWFHTNAAFASSRASEGSFLWEMTAGANNMVGALITPHTYELAYHHSVDRTALLAGDTHGWRQLPTAFIGAAGELTGMNYLVEGGMGYSLHGDQLDFGDRFLHAYGGGTALFGHGILLRSAMPIRGGLHVNNRIGTNEVSTPTQLELGFVDQLADSSGLVIGRGRHISEAIESGAFAPGEYRLSWFSTLPSNRRATRSELDVEWSINQSYLQAVMKLKRPIRDVSPIDDLGGFFLNRERDALGRAGWNYADGWWNPPTQ